MMVTADDNSSQTSQPARAGRGQGVNSIADKLYIYKDKKSICNHLRQFVVWNKNANLKID